MRSTAGPRNPAGLYRPTLPHTNCAYASGRLRRGAPLALLAALVLLCPAPGCSPPNRALSPGNVQLENRARNNTRAALAADVRTPAAADPAAPGPEVVPGPAPANSADPASASPPPTDPRADDGWFVGIAMSGGGSRSANFSAACMFQLQRLGLLDRVDYISSVSGGSLTAAYYCAGTDDEWNPAGVQDKLAHSFASDVITRTFLPWNTAALVATSWDRSDLLADSFEKVLFSRGGRGLTFADLRPDRPRLLINATDLQSARRFIFCDEAFDKLNSDLAAFPLSYAVAASAAVPVLMHHVTLRDYSTAYEQYRHLIDGGVTDNLGVVTLAETYTAHVEAAAAAGRPDPYPHGAVFIILDAKTQYDARLSDMEDIGIIETLVAGSSLTSTALLNRVSSATLAELIVQHSADDVTAEQIRQQIRQLSKTGDLTVRGRNGRPVRVLHLALSRVDELTDLPFQSFGERVNSIATYFNIDPTEAYNLYQAAELLVEERFEKPLADLAAALHRPTAPPDGRTSP